jgi:alpha-ketoglutarate-dependent taurine dioxygenase
LAVGSERAVTVEMVPLSPALGVELRGVDLREEQPEAVCQRARRAFAEYCLILVRGQDISLEQQTRFCQWFGTINTAGRHAGLEPFDPEHPEMYISNTRPEGVAGEGLLKKHQDYCSQETLLPALCLYAEEIPTHGGDTIFASGRRAYQNLPASLARRVSDLRARHLGPTSMDLTEEASGGGAPTTFAPRSAVHPVVLSHPRSDGPILFVNEGMTEGIVGLDHAESGALLASLLGYLEDPAVQYRHQWVVGDVIIWDNLALQHGRTDFQNGARRSLRRLEVA